MTYFTRDTMRIENKVERPKTVLCIFKEGN